MLNWLILHETLFLVSVLKFSFFFHWDINYNKTIFKNKFIKYSFALKFPSYTDGGRSHIPYLLKNLVGGHFRHKNVIFCKLRIKQGLFQRQWDERGGRKEAYKRESRGGHWEVRSRSNIQASSWVWKMGLMTTHRMALWISKETQSAGPREVDGLLAPLLSVTHLSFPSSTPLPHFYLYILSPLWNLWK